jgi:hypothetical protein
VEIEMPAQKPERSDTRTDKRSMPRDERGRFTSDQADTGRSLAADQRQQSDTAAQRSQGDRGDRQTNR